VDGEVSVVKMAAAGRRRIARAQRGGGIHDDIDAGQHGRERASAASVSMASLETADCRLRCCQGEASLPDSADQAWAR
jgi:hypothetical protein